MRCVHTISVTPVAANDHLAAPFCSCAVTDTFVHHMGRSKKNRQTEIQTQKESPLQLLNYIQTATK